jgi:acyl-CoA thioester hydrolase
MLIFDILNDQLTGTRYICRINSDQVYSVSTKTRVRYGETDRMGYVYHGNYPQLYEMARVELLRSLGLSYRDLEESGIMMPVLEVKVNYLKPAFYDDELTIKAVILEMPAARIRFLYEIFNEAGELINHGETVLAFIRADSRRAIRAPESLTSLLRPWFEKNESSRK